MRLNLVNHVGDKAHLLSDGETIVVSFGEQLVFDKGTDSLAYIHSVNWISQVILFSNVECNWYLLNVLKNNERDCLATIVIGVGFITAPVILFEHSFVDNLGVVKNLSDGSRRTWSLVNNLFSLLHIPWGTLQIQKF